MKQILLFTLLILLPFLPGKTQEANCSEIFFSEYVEGSGNNKALEIYNPTDQIIDLSYYFVARYSNGSADFSAGGYTHLQGFLPAHKVFILVNGQTEDVDLGGGNISPRCNPTLQDLAKQFPSQLDHAYPAPTYMNGNDAIALLKSADKTIGNVTPVDIIGEIGLGNVISQEYGWSDIKDTTVSYNVHTNDNTVIVTKGKVINYIVQAHDTSGNHFGPFWLAWTKDHTLVRKPSVKKGVTHNPVPFVVSAEWDTIPGGKDVWDSLGTHTCDCENTTAVHNLRHTPLQVYTYPNPVTDNSFEVIANKAIREVNISNIIGQTVYHSQPIEGSLRRYKIILPDKTVQGIYLVRIKLEDNLFTVRKILVK